MDNNLTPDDRNKVGVYFIRNKATNELYIGSGKLHARLKTHERQLANNRHINYKLQKSFNNNPDMEFVGKAVNVEGLPIELNRKFALGLEQVFIDEYKDNPLLLNIAMKADNPSFGTKLSVEHKAKIGKRSKEIWTAMPFEKKKLRDEKISKAHSEIWSNMTQEEKNDRTEIIRHASIGVSLSEERKKEVGDFFRGKELSSTHKEKISNALRNKSKDPIAVQNGVNARKEKGSYKSNESQILSCSSPVVVDGEVFTSITMCARAKNISRPTVSARIGNSDFPGWTKVRPLI